VHLVFLWPYFLCIIHFKLIPFIPIEGFQEDFLLFVKDGVPPNTYDAIYKIISDILNNRFWFVFWVYIVYIFDGKWIKRNFRWF
jgi:hypothetical protein